MKRCRDEGHPSGKAAEEGPRGRGSCGGSAGEHGGDSSGDHAQQAVASSGVAGVGEGKRTLLVDNYDSYTFNLFQLVHSVTGSEPLVIRNDDYEGYERLKASNALLNIILSPGPGRPDREEDFGVCRRILEEAPVPVLGVCLGYQGLGLVYGMQVNHSPYGPVHGQVSPVMHTGRHPLFAGIEQGFQVVRYHSLALCNHDGSPADFPAHLEKIAWTEDGVVMAAGHRHLPLWGVQFHPESVCSEHGGTLLRNFHNLSTASAASAHPAHSAHVAQADSARASPLRGEEEGGEEAWGGAGSGDGEMAVLFRRVAVQVDAERMYNHLYRDDNRSFWLDSARVQAETGRYSFMGGSRGPLSYHLSYRVRKQEITITHPNGKTEAVQGALLPFLREKLSAAKADCTDVPFDFVGGFVGYLGYELKHDCYDARGEEMRFESADPDACLLFADRILAWDHQEGGCYALCLVLRNDADNVGAGHAWLEATEALVCEMANTSSPAPSRAQSDSEARSHSPDDSVGDEMLGPGSLAFAPLPPSAPPPAPDPGVGPSGHMLTKEGGCVAFQPVRQREGYEEAVRACQRYIHDGESYELCLTTKLRASVPVDPLALYTMLRRRNKAPYAALLRLGADAAVCCSSPERFLNVSRGGVVESRPIKGTRPRGISPEEDREVIQELMGCVKDRAENLMVVDLVRSDLARVCVAGSVAVPRLFSIETYATVHQMVSVVRGQLRRDVTAVCALEHAFPMGSMTGAPKRRSMALLDSIEGEARGVYSGTLGYFSVNGAADLAVVIRTAVCHKEGTWIGAGGAITVLSDPTEEWREMLLKAHAVVDPALETMRSKPERC